MEKTDIYSLYSPEYYGERVGEYGYQHTSQGKIPLGNINKAKQAFYKTLHLDTESRKALNLYCKIKSSLLRS